MKQNNKKHSLLFTLPVLAALVFGTLGATNAFAEDADIGFIPDNVSSERIDTFLDVSPETLDKKGIKMLDAPVSGGPEGAQQGTLAIMVGGEPAVFEKASPILEIMGKTVTHVGPIGAGQITKAINQIILSGTYLTVAEGLTLGMKAGLDMEKVIEAISGGAASSWVLHNRGINVVNNTYPLGFRVRLHHKDLKIALDTARELDVTLPATALVAQIENGLIARGYGDDDVSAIGRSIREQSGLE